MLHAKATRPTNVQFLDSIDKNSRVEDAHTTTQTVSDGINVVVPVVVEVLAAAA